MKLSLTIVAVTLSAGLIAGMLWHHHRNQRVDLPNLEPRSGSVTSSSEFLNAQRSVEYYRNEIEKHPAAVKNYVELADLLLQESRVTGNHHVYIPKAQSLLDEALRREPDNYEALVAQGSIMMTQHRFTEALPVARRVVALRPYTASGYGLLCDALISSCR